MSKKAPTIDQIRRDAGHSMMTCLNDHSFSSITIDMIAAATGHQSSVLRRLFPDMVEMVNQGLRDLDDGILTELADDLAEDVEAGIRERILEGLIVRYERYRPYKQAIRHLNTASTRNPALATSTIHRLTAASRTILELAGDNTSGLAGLLRVKGLAGVALLAQRDWLADESPDMAVTIRVLDQRLKQAEDLAQLVNIIPKYTPDHDEA